MADLLSMLEQKLDEHYVERANYIAHASYVKDWDDYNFRAGYLEAIRNVGIFITQIRNPEIPVDNGEILSVLEEV